MLNGGKLGEPRYEFSMGERGCGVHRFEWYQSCHWSTPFSDDNLAFDAHSSDPVPSFEMKIANGNFSHVHNVHLRMIVSIPTANG